MKKKVEEAKEEVGMGGMLGGLHDFLKSLEEMEKKGVTEEVKTGEMPGPFGSKTRYEYRVRIGQGFRPGKLRVRRGPPLRPRRVRGAGKAIIPRKPAGKEELVDVFDRKDHILVIAELPNVKEKDIDYKIAGDVLKITVNTPKGKIKKGISVPQGSEVDKIERVSFRNGILEIKLRKKKKREK